jgi:hypothetical protein
VVRSVDWNANCLHRMNEAQTLLRGRWAQSNQQMDMRVTVLV